MKEREQIHIVPAAPGWFAVYYCHDDGDDGPPGLFVQEAVIAWRIETRHGVDKYGNDEFTSSTICIGSSGDTDDMWGYQRPDGKVEEVLSGAVFNSLLEATTSANADAVRFKAARAAKPQDKGE